MDKRLTDLKNRFIEIVDSYIDSTNEEIKQNSIDPDKKLSKLISQLEQNILIAELMEGVISKTSIEERLIIYNQIQEMPNNERRDDYIAISYILLQK